MGGELVDEGGVNSANDYVDQDSRYFFNVFFVVPLGELIFVHDN